MESSCPIDGRHEITECERATTLSRDGSDEGGTIMKFSMAPLLMHDPDIPSRVREALRAAHVADPEDRIARLERAARLLREEVDLECADARELVGLDPRRVCSVVP